MALGSAAWRSARPHGARLGRMCLNLLVFLFCSSLGVGLVLKSSSRCSAR
jgi:hypothetical protein